MKKYLLIIPICLLILSESANACSIVVEPISKFDKNEFTFIGKVIGYTEPRIIKNRKGDKRTEEERKTYGLKVQLTEKVYLPQTPKSHFEIFNFGFSSTCGLLPVKLETLKKYFPRNLEVRVNASKINLFEENTPKGVIRLSTFSTHGFIDRNQGKDKVSVTTANSYFDYKNHDSNKTIYEYQRLLLFELKKDLYRLSKEELQSEKELILERILYTPRSSLGYFDIELIIKEHSINSLILMQKFNSHLKSIMNEKEYKNYKEYLKNRHRRLNKSKQ